MFCIMIVDKNVLIEDGDVGGAVNARGLSRSCAGLTVCGEQGVCIMIPADPYHPGLREMVTMIPPISLGPLVSYVLLAIAFHFLGLIFYRLCLSPLRHFPGPRLAAATQWYETYYELFHKGGGSFTKEIKKLHAQYGPIVRINPWELHIDDPEYYETIYASSAPFDKLPVLENRFGVPSAAFSTSAHAVHRKRRAALSPFFAKNQIQARGPFLQQLIDTICRRLESENAGLQNPVTLNRVFACFTADSILSMAFGEDPSYIQTPTWQTPFVQALDTLVQSTHMNTQFPFMVSIANAIPEWLLMLSPSFGPIVEFRRVRSLSYVFQGN